MSTLFEGSIPVLEKALDMYLARHSLIADNIANAETPNYKARQLEFEGDLASAVQSQRSGIDENAINSFSAQVTQDPDSELGQDLNTVDMDREMARLAKNDMQYSAATQAVSKRFALLKYAIAGGGNP